MENFLIRWVMQGVQFRKIILLDTVEGLSESVEKGNFMTKSLFQIIMLNEVVKICQKLYLRMCKS